MTDYTQAQKTKESLVRRLRALLSKTVENGATEAEAMSALAKAQEIMAAHGLDREALEAEAFIREKYTGKQATRAFNWGKEMAYGVMLFTGTYCYVDEGQVPVFCGRESDAIFAFWLMDALDGFVTRNALTYITEGSGVRVNGVRAIRNHAQGSLFGGTEVIQRSRESEVDRKARIRAFSLGVCKRITERLLEMTTTENRIKSENARRQLEREGMRFGKGKSFGGNVGDHDAYNAGKRAGDRATFNRPMGQGEAQRMIA